MSRTRLPLLILLLSCAQPESVDSIHQAVVARVATDPVRPLAGEPAMDGAGNATYTIPLTLPPGRRGVAPSISLTYSSGGGEGYLGTGFELAGVHSWIHRCPKSVAYDGEDSVDGVDFDEEDRLCLDGERLIGDASTGYWDVGATYQQDMNAWRRVRHEGGTYRTFVVELRDGGRKIYGGQNATIWATRGDRDASGALVNTSTVEVAWPLWRVEDRFGNYVELTYEHIDHPDGAYEHRLQSILYTGGPGVTPQREIQFVYSAQFGPRSFFFRGTERRISAVLEELVANVRFSQVRKFELEYDTDAWTGRPVLTSLTECGPLGRCRPPTTFEWSTPSFTTSTAEVMEVPELWIESEGGVLSILWTQTLETGDLDGDSKDEIVYWVDDGSGNNQQLFARFRSASGSWTSPVDLGQEMPFIVTPPRWFEVVPSQHDNRDQVLVRQLDGPENADSTWDVMRYQAASLWVEQENVLGCIHDAGAWWSPGIFTADFNGDGGSDFAGACATGVGTPTVHWSMAAFQPRGYWGDGQLYEEDQALVGPQYARQFPIDFDGDRRAEVLSVPTTHALVLPTETPPASGLVAVADVGTPMSELPPIYLPVDEEYVFADLNGDGLVDAASIAADGMYIRLNTGRGFGPRTNAFSTPPVWNDLLAYQYLHGGDVRVADFDRDGRQDLLVPVAVSPSSTTFALCRWVNGVLVPTEFSTTSFPYGVDWCVRVEDGDCVEWDGASMWHTFQLLDDDGDGDISFTHVVEDAPHDYHLETVEIEVTERPAVLERVVDNLSNPQFSYTDLSQVLLPEPHLLAPPRACPVPEEGPVPPCPPGGPLPDVSSCIDDYPNVCSERGWVADRITLSNGQSTYPIRREYSPRVVDVRRGVGLGFQVIGEDELVAGAPRHTETRFDLAYEDSLGPMEDIIDRRSPFAGLVSQVDTYQWPDAQGISEGSWPPSPRRVIATRTISRRQVQESSLVAGAFRRLLTWRDTQVFEPELHQLFQNTLEDTDLIYHWREATVPDAWGTTELAYFYDVLGGESERFTQNVLFNDVGSYRIGRLQARDIESIEGLQARTRHYEYEYDTAGNLEIVYNERGTSDEARVEYDYDTWGNVERIDRYVTNPEFDPGDPAEPAQIHRFDILRYETVEHNDLEEHENALGHVTEYESWPDTGDTYLIRDPNGIEQTFVYDGFGNVLEHAHHGVVDTFDRTLSSGGCYELDVDPDGLPRTWTKFDCFGRPISIQEQVPGPAPDTIREYKYDSAGLLLYDVRPHFVGAPKYPITLLYDGLGRLLTRQLPTGEIEEWSYLGRQTEHANLRGGTEWVRRDTMARVGEHQIEVAMGAPEDRAVHHYGPFGVLTSVSHLGFDTVFEHDIYGQIEHIDHPDSGDRWLTNNAFGEVENTTFADGSTRNTEYDVLGRVIGIEEPGNDVTYVYDTGANGIGRLTSALRDAAVDVQTTFSYAADPYGRLGTTTTTVDGEPFVEALTYDGIHVETLTYQATGLTAPSIELDYARNSAGRLDSVTGSSGSWSQVMWVNNARDESGRSTVETRGPIVLQRDYDNVSGLLSHSLATMGSTTVDAHQYGYEDGDYLDTDWDQLAGITYGFVYDDRGRLREYRANASLLRDYDYDEFGNQTEGVNTRTFDVDGRPHTLDTAGALSFTNDLRGRRTDRSDGWQAAYNQFDLPQWIMQPGGQTTSYAYDAFESRVHEFDGTSTTIELGAYQRVTKSGKHKTRVQVYADGELIAELRDGSRNGVQVSWQVESPLGTSSTSVTGSTVKHPERPDPFGATSGLPGEGLRFAGHDFETVGRLVNAKGRIYDPSNATFLTPDPFVFTSGRQENPFQYAMWNPLSYTDPTGFAPTPDIWVSPDGGARIIDWSGDGGPTIYEGAFVPYQAGALRMWSPENPVTTSKSIYSAPWTESIDVSPDSALVVAGDYSSGFGDRASFGLTGWTRSHFAGGDQVNTDSAAYSAGEWTSVATDVISAAGALRGILRNGNRITSALAPAGGGGGAAAARGPIFADTNLIIAAAEQGSASALAELRAGITYITPNQWRELMNVTTQAQRSARRAFLQAEGIELFAGARARVAASLPGFQTVFNAVRLHKGRGDAALAAFAHVTGFQAVTAERNLTQFLNFTLTKLGVSIRRVVP